MNIIEPASAYKKPIISVGEEFVNWAEKYWLLGELMDTKTRNPSEKGGENCPYHVVRAAFIKQIDELIQQRVKHYL